VEHRRTRKARSEAPVLSLSFYDGQLNVTNGTILDPKCDIVFTPDVILGAGEAMRRREFIGACAAVCDAGNWISQQ
jgi:hypothetical protein